MENGSVWWKWRRIVKKQGSKHSVADFGFGVYNNHHYRWEYFVTQLHYLRRLIQLRKYRSTTLLEFCFGPPAWESVGLAFTCSPYCQSLRIVVTFLVQSHIWLQSLRILLISYSDWLGGVVYFFHLLNSIIISLLSDYLQYWRQSIFYPVWQIDFKTFTWKKIHFSIVKSRCICSFKSNSVLQKIRTDS